MNNEVREYDFFLIVDFLILILFFNIDILQYLI